MKVALLTTLFLLLTGCAGAILEDIGGTRVIDFADPDQRFQALAETVPMPAFPIDPGQREDADAECRQRHGFNHSSVAVVPNVGLICVPVPPDAKVRDGLCPMLGFAHGEVDGTVLTCRGPIPVAKPEPDQPKAEGARA